MECLDGATILVQGSTKKPYEVNQHIEEFLTKFEEYLNSMNAEEFSTMKDGAVLLHYIIDQPISIEGQNTILGFS